MEDFSVVLPLQEIDNWRSLYPNGGYIRGLEHLHVQNILATNGCLALFHTPGRRNAWFGHLSNFLGPVAKEFVPDEDWDWKRNTRQVKVFRRKDGTCAIIPQDTLREEYFEGKTRMSKMEIELYAALGATKMLPCEFETALEELTVRAKPVTQSTRQAILASL